MHSKRNGSEFDRSSRELHQLQQLQLSLTRFDPKIERPAQGEIQTTFNRRLIHGGSIEDFRR